MAVLFGTHPRYLEHLTGPSHPESPSRLGAVWEGIRQAGLEEAVEPFLPRAAARSELERVHTARYLDAIEKLCSSGPGPVDADTWVGGPESWEAALLAAGAGLEAAERLAAAGAGSAFLAVRPPGHHARPAQAMGFCLINNVAVVSAALAEQGEKVLVLDWDVHHGNGTQDVFYSDPRVMYVSLHQYPFYPGTGSASETGAGPGAGTTINVPLPAGTRGDAYRRAFDEVVAPASEAFGPSWLVVSAGFDAHRCDPLADVELSAGDFADLTALSVSLVPTGRRILFLEGGYDLEALAASAGACVASLADHRYRPEAATSGEAGLAAVEAVRVARDAS